MRYAKLFLCLIVVALGVSFSQSPLFASSSEVEALLKVLVKRGVISEKEAASVLQEAKKVVEEQKKEIARESAAKMPSWVENTKFKGDIRMRYQTSKKKKDDVARNRARIRFRYGFETRVSDTLKVGARMATGSADPRSTNQTLGDTFATKSWQLDKAYLKYQPTEAFEVLAGKFNKAFFVRDDLLWDGDITFEGLSLIFKPEVSESTKLFFNTGLFVLDELKSSDKDPLMSYFQPGFEAKISDNISWKMGLAYYSFENVKGNTLDHSAGTNTLKDGVLKYDYDSINPSTVLTYAWDSLDKTYAVSLLYDYIYNPDSKDKGYLVGIKFGSKKVKDRGDWQVYYNYRQLEKDAWLDTFPDSDFYGGKTDVKGYEVVIKYGLAKHISLGLDYYRTRRMDAEANPESVLQADLGIKF